MIRDGDRYIYNTMCVYYDTEPVQCIDTFVYNNNNNVLFTSIHRHRCEIPATFRQSDTTWASIYKKRAKLKWTWKSLHTLFSDFSTTHSRASITRMIRHQTLTPRQNEDRYPAIIRFRIDLLYHMFSSFSVSIASLSRGNQQYEVFRKFVSAGAGNHIWPTWGADAISLKMSRIYW